MAKRYFVEFRARYALSYGHTFVAYGRLDAKNNILERTVAGLHPAGDSPTPWMIGHLVPVVSDTGPSDGDLEDEYISARYRVVMNAEEYDRTVKYIKNLQASSPLWHAVVYNCSAFVGDIARSMGLRTPASTLLFPQNYINQLKQLNASPETDVLETSSH